MNEMWMYGEGENETRRIQMGRKASLPAGFMDCNFENAYRIEGDGRTRIRLLAMMHLQDGKTITEVAKIIKMDRGRITVWLKRFEDEHLDGLSDKPKPGCTPKLPRSKEEEFKARVIELQKERKGGRVTGEVIRQMLADEFGVEYTVSGVYDLLKRVNMVWVTARTIHPEEDPEKQQEFKDNFVEKVEERLPEGVETKDLEIWFQDEMRAGQQGTITKIWTEKGTRPLVPCQKQFISAYIFGAVCAETGISAGIIMPYANTEAMAIHLEVISECVAEDKHAVVIMDKASWHTTEKLECPGNISLLPLPPHSPQLNPVEYIWKQLRQNHLSNRCFEDYDEIVDACCDAWNDFAADADSIKSLCHREWACIKDEET